MGHREFAVHAAVCSVCAAIKLTDAFWTTSLRLQIYRGLGIEPILNDDAELDRVLISQWPLSGCLSMRWINVD
jgi:hypothetical protein